jgi:hypothetical protein
VCTPFPIGAALGPGAEKFKILDLDPKIRKKWIGCIPSATISFAALIKIGFLFLGLVPLEKAFRCEGVKDLENYNRVVSHATDIINTIRDPKSLLPALVKSECITRQLHVAISFCTDYRGTLIN